jgi:DNA-binding XRE family transcriptional regulator
MCELFLTDWESYVSGMSDGPETKFVADFRRRTKELRMNRGYTQKEVADFLGIELEAYKKYENRSILPQFLMVRFCRLVGCELQDLFRAPMLPPNIPIGRPPKYGKH